MILRPWHARCLGLLAAAASFAFPAVALALTVSGPIDLGGDAPPFYDTVTITGSGVLTVKPYVSGSAVSTGWVTLKANTITVQAGGSIVADGAGYQGQDGKYGNCALMSA